jgi:uncharacterized C2H2 Zn-finger protein
MEFLFLLKTIKLTNQNHIMIKRVIHNKISFLINVFNVRLKIAFMRFFSKEKVILETKCRECGMEFSESERMIRHMIKAHTKKKPSCNC